MRVLNKLDRLSAEERHALDHNGKAEHGRDEGPVLVSAMTGEGIDELLRRIDVALPTDPLVSLSLRLPLSQGRTLALIHALGRVLRSEVEDEDMLLDAEVPVSIARRLRLNDFVIEGTSKLALT